MFKMFDIKNSQKILIIISLFCFLSSVCAEIFLDKKPCDLCLYTRYLYILIAALGFISLRCPRVLFKQMLLALLFIAFCFSFYHLGVENHWWAGPAKCTTKLLTDMKSIMDNDTIRCDVVNWELFGISSTLYNMCIMACIFWLYSLSFAIDSLKRRKEG